MRLSRKLMLIPISGLLAFLVIWATVGYFDELNSSNQKNINQVLFPTYTQTDQFIRQLQGIHKVVKDPVALAMDDQHSYENAKKALKKLFPPSIK